MLPNNKKSTPPRSSVIVDDNISLVNDASDEFNTTEASATTASALSTANSSRGGPPKQFVSYKSNMIVSVEEQQQEEDERMNNNYEIQQTQQQQQRLSPPKKSSSLKRPSVGSTSCITQDSVCSLKPPNIRGNDNNIDMPSDLSDDMILREPDRLQVQPREREANQQQQRQQQQEEKSKNPPLRQEVGVGIVVKEKTKTSTSNRFGRQSRSSNNNNNNRLRKSRRQQQNAKEEEKKESDHDGPIHVNVNNFPSTVKEEEGDNDQLPKLLKNKNDNNMISSDDDDNIHPTNNYINNLREFQVQKKLHEMDNDDSFNHDVDAISSSLRTSTTTTTSTSSTAVRRSANNRRGRRYTDKILKTFRSSTAAGGGGRVEEEEEDDEEGISSSEVVSNNDDDSNNISRKTRRLGGRAVEVEKSVTSISNSHRERRNRWRRSRRDQSNNDNNNYSENNETPQRQRPPPSPPPPPPPPPPPATLSRDYQNGDYDEEDDDDYYFVSPGAVAVNGDGYERYRGDASLSSQGTPTSYASRKQYSSVASASKEEEQSRGGTSSGELVTVTRSAPTPIAYASNPEEEFPTIRRSNMNTRDIENGHVHNIANNSRDDKQKWYCTNQFKIIVLILCIIGIAIGVVVPLVLSSSSSSSSSGDNGNTPTLGPVIATSPQPTVPATVPIDFEKRKDAILSALVPDVTSSIILGTPQEKAFDWIVNEDTTFSTLDNFEKLKQRFVLAVFYFSTSGEGWIKKGNWLDTSLDECGGSNDGWNFLSCTTNNAGFDDEMVDESDVVAIQLTRDNNLNGPIPKELSSLTALHTLVFLDGNNITKIPPELNALHNSLVTLKIGGKSASINDDNAVGFVDTGYTIPSVIYELTSLEYLRLNEYKLKGTISSDIAKLTNLRHLELSGFTNELNGTIPFELYENPPSKLEHIILSNIDASVTTVKGLGSLEGNVTNIITGFGVSLSNLITLDMSGNQLTGSIPNDISKFNDGLVTLRLQQNNITGSIPSSIGELTHLEVLYLSHNNINGSIPVEIGNLSKLSLLGLYNNDLSGTLPEEICDLRIERGGILELFNIDSSIECPYDESCCEPSTI